MALRTVLLNPQFKEKFGRFSREQRSPAITKGGTFYYPMWLCAGAGALEKAGFEILIIDAPAGRCTFEQVAADICAFTPQLLIVATSTPSINNNVQAAEALKKMTGAFTVLVGPHVSALPEDSLNRCMTVDAVARKEYDATLVDLARRLEAGGGRLGRAALSAIDGLSFRDDSRIVNNPDRALIENLDQLPFLSAVYKKHLNVRNYFYTMCQYPLVTLFAGRGCPFRCVYCVYPQTMTSRKYRARSAENLIAEFKYIEKELPEVREIFIEDDTFTANRPRARAFCDAYLRERLRLSWVANSRADVDLETLLLMKKARCRQLCVGFESGDQEVLDQMKKGLKVERAKQFARDARKAGILIHGCFMVGNPGETKETLQTTLKYAKELNPDTAQFFPVMVYPGTDAYAWAKSNGYLITEDFTRWNTEEGLHNCMISRPGLSNVELVEFCDDARKEFYLRLRYLAYRLGRLVRHPIEDGPRMFKSMKAF